MAQVSRIVWGTSTSHGFSPRTLPEQSTDPLDVTFSKEEHQSIHAGRSSFVENPRFRAIPRGFRQILGIFCCGNRIVAADRRRRVRIEEPRARRGGGVGAVG